MITSPLWNLFYIAATIGALGFAYYSRHEQVQKLGLYLFATNMASHVVIHTEAHLATYIAMDAIGAAYALKLIPLDGSSQLCQRMVVLFLAQLYAHSFHETGLVWIIAGNVLYMAQLATISYFGTKHGRASRCNPAPKKRQPPFQRFAAMFA
jgi:hypothetical protein